MDFLYTLLNMLNEMSPYILLGFLIAGLLHAFVPERTMSRHLSGRGLKSVIKGAMIGVPLPLCSCGVLPTAVALRRSGASKAASTSFLIATPQTGVDSIAATWSLLGPAMAVIRPVAALATSIVGGMAVGATEKADDRAAASCPVPDTEERPGFRRRLAIALDYGFNTMVGSIGKWLVLGLVIAALITILVPENFLAALGDRPLLAMLAVVAVAVPMYVCATGSIPIAMSLMLKGLSPGAAFVLLMAGPAANFASITVIAKTMGRRSAAVYLGTIVAGAIAVGLAIDLLMPRQWFPLQSTAACSGHGIDLLSTACSALLIGLLVKAFVPRLFKSKSNIITDKMTTVYHIKGMSCAHCKASVEKNLARVPGVESVEVDLASGTATVAGEHDHAAAVKMIEDIGFVPAD